MNQINNYYYLGCWVFLLLFLVLAVGFVVLFVVVVFIKAM